MFYSILSVFTALMLSLVGFFGYDFTDRMPEEPAFPIIDCEEQPEGSIRVMSFNVRCADVNGVPVKYRKQLIADEILHVAPDSVGVQEAIPEVMAYLRAALPGYASVGVGRDDGRSSGEHSAIFYNSFRWKLLDSGTFWLSETPDEVSIGWDAACKRICTWAVLQNRLTGETYVHLNSHFDHVSETARRNSAKLIISFIEENFSGFNVVFTADLNSSPATAAYITMTSLLEDTRLTALEAKEFPTFPSIGGGVNGSYIDHILVSPGTEVLSYRTVTSGIDGRYVSDHYPIYADIVVPANEPASLIGRLFNRLINTVC